MPTLLHKSLSINTQVKAFIFLITHHRYILKGKWFINICRRLFVNSILRNVEFALYCSIWLLKVDVGLTLEEAIAKGVPFVCGFCDLMCKTVCSSEDVLLVTYTKNFALFVNLTCELKKFLLRPSDLYTYDFRNRRQHLQNCLPWN